MPLDYPRLRELFEAACDLPESEQESFVEVQCADDPAMREELLALLRSDGRTSGIFADDRTTGGIQFQIDTVVDSELPERIGQYEVKSVLGQGGMGVVYLALQQNPRRDVAVKVIRSGIASPELLKRFELEVEVLGRLKHPGIARIHEAGIFVDSSTGQRRPFLAMEYVDGLPLREFIQQSDLNKRDRLKLVVEICAAVNHAHQRGVIHRDLKPGNILVRDNRQPTVLDFGVARATVKDLESSVLQTHAGQLIGTLPYMSPEQVTGNSLDVDTRSDVYALGVIAYELLTGELPYAIDDRDYLKSAKVISEHKPKPLSSINREFRGDLNTIILKSLEKEPDRRYQSAQAMGDDIERFLNDQPVLARPATAFYQLKQFSKRNKALVAGFLASFVLLIGGVIGTTRGMMNAQQESKRKDAINTFMTDILVANDAVTGNPNAKMIDVLREAAESAPERFRDYPELEAEVSQLLGTGFSRLTFNLDAMPLHQRAFELNKTRLGMQHPLTRKSGADFAKHFANSDSSGTIDFVNELLAHTPSDNLLNQETVSLRISMARAYVRLQKIDIAEEELRKVLADLNGLEDTNAPVVRQVCIGLATTLMRKVEFGVSNNVETDIQEAIQLYRDAASGSTADKGEGHFETLQIMLSLIVVLQLAGEYQEAEKLSYKVMELASPRFDAEHRMNTRPKRELSRMLYKQDRYIEAGKFRVEYVQLIRQKQGSKNIFSVALMADALPVVEAAGRFVDGEEYARVVMENMGSRPNLKASGQLFLARFLSAQGKTAEAEDEFERVLASGQMESDEYVKCLFQLFMGEHKLAEGNYLEASKMFKESLRLRGSFEKYSNPRIARIKDAIKRANSSIDAANLQDQ